MAALADYRVDWTALARLLVGVVLILAMVLGPGIYGQMTSGDRVAPGLEAVNGAVNVRVTMSFRPQAFQQTELTKYGVFGGRRGDGIVLFNVSQQNLRKIKNLYWVDAIVPFVRS
jgi:hypothetical protein